MLGVWPHERERHVISPSSQHCERVLIENDCLAVAGSLLVIVPYKTLRGTFGILVQ